MKLRVSGLCQDLSGSKKRTGSTLGTSHTSVEALAQVLCLTDHRWMTKGGAGWGSTFDDCCTLDISINDMGQFLGLDVS